MKINKFLIKICDLIIKFRYLFLCIFIALTIICSININNYKVNYDLTSYLPSEMETRYGLKLMKSEFGDVSEVQILLTHISYQEAMNKVESIKNIEHVKNIFFNDTEDHYKDNNALIVIELDKVNKDEKLIIKNDIVKLVKSNEYYLYMENDYSDNSSFSFVAILIIGVIILFFTSHSYFDIIIAGIIISVSILFNLGSNCLLDNVSYITNFTTIIIQLGLSIYYLILFLGYFYEEIDDSSNKILAIKKTLYKSIPIIFINSFAIAFVLISLLFMHFNIGRELFIVIIKSIICTIFTIILLLPCLLIIFNKVILKLRHRNYIPDVTKLINIIVSGRKIILSIFLFLVIISIFFIPRYNYIYNKFFINSNKVDNNQLAFNKINEIFNTSNRLIIMVNNNDKDYTKELMLAKKLLQDKKIISVINIGNTNILDNLYLGSSINYQEFANSFNIDLQTSLSIYQMIANKSDELIKLNDIDNYHISLNKLITFLYDNQIELLNDDIKDKINNYYLKLNSNINLLESNNYSRFIIKYKGNIESEDTFKLLKMIREDVEKNYDEVIMIGDGISAYDLKSTFNSDNIKFIFIMLLFIIIILLFIFKSISMSILLTFIVEGSILMNFMFMHNKIYFINYIVVSIIQMVIILSYIIVIFSRYRFIRMKNNKKGTLLKALKDSFPAIIISGLIISISGFLISYKCYSFVIASIGESFSIGIIISMISTIVVLPAFLYVFDKKSKNILNIYKK